MRTDRTQRGEHRPCGRDVVVLDERLVAETHAVVDAAADAHRVLLQCAKAGQRLAAVADLRLGALHRVDPLRRGGRDARQVAQNIEHRPFGGEQPARRGVDGEHGLPRHDAVAVVGAVDHPVVIRSDHLVEDEKSDVESGDGPGLPGNDRRGGGRVCGHGGVRGDVGSVAQVLVEGAHDQRARLLEIEAGGQGGGHISSLLSVAVW